MNNQTDTQNGQVVLETEYDEEFIGEVEILHFENHREALSRQSIRFDEPQLLEMSPVAIKNFLMKNKFDLSHEAAVVLKSFTWMSCWDDYYTELSDWLGNGLLPDDEPIHPSKTCYPTSYLRTV